MSTNATTAGESLQNIPATSGPVITRQKSKAYTSSIAAQTDDQKYFAKYKELKKKVKEIESENDQLHLKVLKTKKSIQRLRLERAILYERLAAIPPTGPMPAGPPQQQYQSQPYPQGLPPPGPVMQGLSREMRHGGRAGPAYYGPRPSHSNHEHLQPLAAPPISHRGAQDSLSPAFQHLGPPPIQRAQSRDNSPPGSYIPYDGPPGIGSLQLPKPPDVNSPQVRDKDSNFSNGSRHGTPPLRYILEDFSGGNNSRSSQHSSSTETERHRSELNAPEGPQNSRHPSPLVGDSSSRLKHPRSVSSENVMPAKRFKSDEALRASPGSLGHEGDEVRVSRLKPSRTGIRGDGEIGQGDSLPQSRFHNGVEDVVLHDDQN